MKKKYSIKNKKQPKIVNETELFAKTDTSTIRENLFFESSFRQYLVIFILSFILYGNTLTLEYALDDRLMITENNFTKKGIAGLKDILTNDAFVGFFGEQKNLLTGGRYRPLSQLMFAIEYELFGLNPFVGHLINILLYALSCVVLLKLLKLMFRGYTGLSKFLPYVITLFFMAHPLHTEIVANIKGRDDIMSFLGAAYVLFLVMRYLDKPHIKYLLMATVVFFLTLMSKENAITFLGIVPLTIFFFRKVSVKDLIICMAPLAMASVAFILLRYAVLGYELNIGVERELLNNPFVNSTDSEKYATIFYTLGVYLKLLFIPHPLTHDYYPFHIEIVNWGSAKAIVPLLIYLCMGFYALWGVFKKQLPAYAIAFYLMTLSIASNIVFNIGTFMNERFLYVPLLGFCIVLAYSLIYFVNRFSKNKLQAQKTLSIIVLVIFLAYAPKTISRNLAWKNDFTLFTTDVKVSKNSAKCNVSAGGILLEESQKLSDDKEKKAYYEQALIYLKRGVEIHPRYVAAWVLYGNAFLYLEQYEQALVCYENALRLAPRINDALTNLAHLAHIVQNKEMYDFSIHVFDVLSSFRNLSVEERYNLARAYEGKNDTDKAMEILFEIIEEASDNFNAHSKLGELYGKAYNNIDKSLEHLLKAYEIKPEDASNLENLGIAYGINRTFDKSLHFFEKAMELNPTKPELYINVSQTYAIMGLSDKAQEYLIKAQEVRAREQKQ